MSQLTKAQKRLIELDNQKEAIKAYHEEYKTVIAEVAAESMDSNHFHGIMFQDPLTSLVYEVVEPDGKYVYFEKLSLNRTKKDDEKRGTLSKKKAEENGFDI